MVFNLQSYNLNVAIPLWRYAQIVNYHECAFFGVSHPNNDNYACREIWTKFQRDDIEYYLAEAQDEIEEVAGFPLSPQWFTNEQHPYTSKILTKKSKIIAAGVMSETVVASGAVVSHVADPAVVTIATALTDTDGIYVFYPDEEKQIMPSNMEITGGNLVITIPRCRMVKWELLDNEPAGLDYNLVANFQATVDVKLVVNDESIQATLVWPHDCNHSCTVCNEYTYTGCEYILDPDIGSVQVVQGQYSAGSWNSRTSTCKGRPHLVRLNYYAGLTELTRRAQSTIVRLAHSKMPNEPCGCEVVQSMWRRDRVTPQFQTRERLECPFGMNDGAWVAWRWANNLAMHRLSVM